MSRTEDVARIPVQYAAACDYNTVQVDEAAVETALRAYCAALGVTRIVTRLHAGWTLEEHPTLARTVREILPAARAAQHAQTALDAQSARNAQSARATRAARAAQHAQIARAAQSALTARATRAALAAQDARNAQSDQTARNAQSAQSALAAQDALTAQSDQSARNAQSARAARAAQAAQDAQTARAAQPALTAQDARNALARFASWCIYRGGWWWSWDLSWLATTYVGALSTRATAVIAWSRPVFEAFCAGAWLLYWTDDTLYWVAVPRVHVERATRRLHRADGPALESDLEPLFFWHGVLVPSHAVLAPETITLAEIAAERNAEVRRVLIERMGWDRYLVESNAHLTHADRFGDLYEIDLDGARLGVVVVQNRTPEPDGSGRLKRYGLRVPPGYPTAHAAVAATFGLTPETYQPVIET